MQRERISEGLNKITQSMQEFFFFERLYNFLWQLVLNLATESLCVCVCVRARQLEISIIFIFWDTNQTIDKALCRHQAEAFKFLYTSFKDKQGFYGNWKRS